MTKKIIFATVFWEANKNSLDFSRMYSTEWVEKLYRGFERHTSYDFEFVVYTDRFRDYDNPIKQVLLRGDPPFDYKDVLQPYELNSPMILVGLDTLITGNIDHLIEYCLTEKKIALPKAVYKKNTVCNGVSLTPEGFGWIWDEFIKSFDMNERTGQEDMEFLRKQDYNVIDDLFPGHVVSYKGHVKKNGLGDARIVFFHGKEKPHELLEDLSWIKENWN